MNYVFWYVGISTLVLAVLLCVFNRRSRAIDAENDEHSNMTTWGEK